MLSIVSIYIEHPSDKVPNKGAGWLIEYVPRIDLGKIIVDLNRGITYVTDAKYTIQINKSSKASFIVEYIVDIEFEDDVNLVVEYISNEPLAKLSAAEYPTA
ncbi:MAG: hypothetical protein Q8M04_03345 [Pseudomonadota bacterium]|nr:hypothetical protein [Pseudomonadota bacterium]